MYIFMEASQLYMCTNIGQTKLNWWVTYCRGTGWGCVKGVKMFKDSVKLCDKHPIITRNMQCNEPHTFWG